MCLPKNARRYKARRVKSHNLEKFIVTHFALPQPLPCEQRSLRSSLKKRGPLLAGYPTLCNVDWLS